MVDNSNVIKEGDYTIMNDNVIEIVGYRTEEPLPEDHFAIDGFRADVLISPDTLEYLQKINEVVMEGECMWFKSLTTCRYDPHTGDVFDVSD
jgi:hypothetical protein